MTGLVVFSVVLMALLQLQKMTPWLVWVMLGIIGLRYAFVGVSKMSKYIDTVNRDEIFERLRNGKKSKYPSIFTDEIFVALEQLGQERIFGQEHVLDAIVAKIKANAQIPQREHPFLSAAFFGPPGVGKTTLAKQLCKAIFKDDDYFFGINSSQYKDHDISSLFGAGKGYQGSDSYGGLTNFLREKGKGVILVDEADRVGGNVQSWIQAWMTVLDGELTEVSTNQKFSSRDTAILFASNYEYEKLGHVVENCKKQNPTMTPEELSDTMRKELTKALTGPIFPEAFLDRLDLVLVFSNLNENSMLDIVLNEIHGLADIHKIQIEFIDTDILVAGIAPAMDGNNVGARNFQRWVRHCVNPALSDASLQNAKKVKLHMTPDGKVYATITETHDEQPANPPRRGGRS